jgi:plastocyanin
MRARFALAVVPAVAAISWLMVSGDVSSAAGKPKPTCTPDGTSLTVSAKNNAFGKDCLAAPANTSFTIAFDNQDSDIHNVSIYDKAHGDKPLYKGEVIYGPKSITYSVAAQAEGTYEFRCDPHADSMIGTFIVGSGDPTGPPSSTTSSTTTQNTEQGYPLARPSDRMRSAKHSSQTNPLVTVRVSPTRRIRPDWAR